MFDGIDKKLQWDHVNELLATCYKKQSDNHHKYIQPIVHNYEIDFNFKRKDKIIIPKAPIYSSPEVLNGIVKNIIPLYCLIMTKNHSRVELVSSNIKNGHKNEFQMITKYISWVPNPSKHERYN